MKWSKDSWGLNSLTYNPVVLSYEHHLTWNALLSGKCTWHVRRALPEQCFQLLKQASSVAPVHHGSIVCSVRVTVLCVCFCWVINVYVTHENRRSSCQNDSVKCISFLGTQSCSSSTLLLIFTGSCCLYEMQRCCRMKFCLFKKGDLNMLCLILLN